MNEAMHICLSGNPACSGINPCEACHKVYVATILPKAMVAAGFNGSAQIAQSFFAAYATARQAVLHALAAQIQAQQPTLNGAEPPDEVESLAETSEGEEWQETTAPLTDSEVSRMAAEPPEDFAPEPDAEDEDPGMPDQERAKEVAAALLAGKPLTHELDTVPQGQEDSPSPAGPEGVEKPASAPRRTRAKKSKTGDNASKE